MTVESTRAANPCGTAPALHSQDGARDLVALVLARFDQSKQLIARCRDLRARSPHDFRMLRLVARLADANAVFGAAAAQGKIDAPPKTWPELAVAFGKSGRGRRMRKRVLTPPGPRRRGAPAGNHNALKHGKFTRERYALYADVRAYVHEGRTAVADVIAQGCGVKSANPEIFSADQRLDYELNCDSFFIGMAPSSG